MVRANEKQMLVTYLPAAAGTGGALLPGAGPGCRDRWDTRRPKDIYNITAYADMGTGLPLAILGIPMPAPAGRRRAEQSACPKPKNFAGNVKT